MRRRRKEGLRSRRGRGELKSREESTYLVVVVADPHLWWRGSRSWLIGEHGVAMKAAEEEGREGAPASSREGSELARAWHPSRVSQQQ